MSGDESEIELTIGADEFSRWLRPKAAIHILTSEMNWEPALEALLKYLMSGVLLARADRVIIEKRGHQETFRRSPIPRGRWDHGNPSFVDAFWENGLFDWSEGMGYDERKFSALDVRFDPEVIRGMVEPSLAPPTPSLPERQGASVSEPKTRHGMPGLRDDLLEKWHALFVAAYPKGSKEMAEKSAHGMFQEHSVDRQKVRDLIGMKPIGRPLKNKDK